MRRKLPVYIENNDLPVDSYSIKSSKKTSFGYVNVMYLTSIVLTILSVLTIMFFGKQVIKYDE